MYKKRLFFHGILICGLFVALRNYRTIDFFFEDEPYFEKVYEEKKTDEILEIPVEDFRDRVWGLSVPKFEISFEFRTDQTDKYQGLFQTKTQNQGLRLELVPNGPVGVVYHVAGNDFGSFYFPEKIVPKTWYKFSLQFDGQDIRSYLNEIERRTPVRMLGAKAFDNIKIGIGFDDLRVFKGQIRNIRVYLGVVKMKLWAQALFMISILGTGIYFIFLVREVYKTFFSTSSS